jgi:hypothetical protein
MNGNSMSDCLLVTCSSVQELIKGCSEHGDKQTGSIECGEYFVAEQLLAG